MMLAHMKTMLFSPVDGWRQSMIAIDKSFLILACSLLSIGLVVMTSASIDYAAYKFNNPLHFFMRQSIFLLMGLSLACAVTVTPMYKWYQWSGICLTLGFVVLIAVLIPGIGREVNGSMRWIPIGPINLQSSELAKLCIMIYMAAYLVRRQDEVRETWQGFIKPILVVSGMIILLLLEPDFGSSVVMIIATMGMIFLGGVGLKQFLSVAMVAALAVMLMAVSSSYRMARLKCFIDPWQYQFDCGYQLTQSLIAFGRGDFFGLGLGNSIQKLFYLPEAHTDFVFAILAEETGFFGGLVILILFSALIYKIYTIAKVAEQKQQLFNAYLCYGIALVMAAQVFINIGVNSGVLPTKGLTLPFFSYGGSSLIVALVMIGFVNRVAIECKLSAIKNASELAKQQQLQSKKKVRKGLKQAGLGKTSAKHDLKPRSSAGFSS